MASWWNAVVARWQVNWIGRWRAVQNQRLLVFKNWLLNGRGPKIISIFERSIWPAPLWIYFVHFWPPTRRRWATIIFFSSALGQIHFVYQYVSFILFFWENVDKLAWWRLHKLVTVIWFQQVSSCWGWRGHSWLHCTTTWRLAGKTII